MHSKMESGHWSRSKCRAGLSVKSHFNSFIFIFCVDKTNRICRGTFKSASAVFCYSQAYAKLKLLPTSFPNMRVHTVVLSGKNIRKFAKISHNAVLLGVKLYY